MGICPESLLQTIRQDLSDQVGSETLRLYDLGVKSWPEMTVGEAAAVSLLDSFFKKLKKKQTAAADLAALRLFREINARSLEWTMPVNTSFDEVLIGELKCLLDEFFYRQNGEPVLGHWYNFLDLSRVGPGSNVGSTGTSFYHKLCASRLTASDPALYSWYRRYVLQFPRWESSENYRIDHFGDVDIVDCSRVCLVPKNDKISRLICVEPILDTFFQLGMAEILNARLYRFFGVDMRTQQFTNRKLAKLGSEDGSLVTIDLRSASDTISYKVLRQLLPGPVFRTLERFRTNYCEMPDGERIELGMFSTMGNGLTFPLQTILFSAVVVAATRALGFGREMRKAGEAWSVFGDDIICPNGAIYRAVSRLLELIGCLVNHDKSFAEGPFRESCGHDYFTGVNIRGVYVKSLDTPQDRYAVINQLNLFSARTGLYLPRTVGVLRESVKWLPVPLVENDDSGIRVPVELAYGPSITWDRRCSWFSYEKMTPTPKVIRFREDGEIVAPRGIKRPFYNPDGLLMSFLQRSINGGAISVRHDRVRYRRRQGIISFWDMRPSDLLSHPWDKSFWLRWNTAVRFNLTGKIET
jgi:hypothetical protein